MRIKNIFNINNNNKKNLIGFFMSQLIKDNKR